MMTIGDVVKDFRTNQNMTQYELGNKSSTSERTVRRLENNEVGTKADTIKKILKVLVK